MSANVERCDCGHSAADHWWETDECMECSCTSFLTQSIKEERDRQYRLNMERTTHAVGCICGTCSAQYERERQA